MDNFALPFGLQGVEKLLILFHGHQPINLPIGELQSHE